MKTVAIILCGLLAIAHGRVIESDSLHPRVVNGEDAKIGERPFQVSLQTSGHFCGGSIIDEYWIVTAAHCVYSQVGAQIKVVAGTINLKEPFSIHYSTKIIVHPDYNSLTVENDIALVKVIIPFKFSERLQPVALPEFHADVQANSSAVLSGWGGLVNTWSGTTDVLQKATIYIADHEYCRSTMWEQSKRVYPTNVCAFDPSIRRGQCNGDSGGPLTVDGKLTGIVSWSIKDPDCASTKYPGIYTRVSEFIDWIRENAQ